MTSRNGLWRLWRSVWVVRLVAVTAFAAIVIQFGLEDGSQLLRPLFYLELGAVGVYVLWTMTRRVPGQSLWQLLVENKLDIGVMVGVLLAMVVVHLVIPDADRGIPTFLFRSIQAALLVRVCAGAARLNILVSQSGLQPTRAISLTFGMLISIGTLALSLPRATSPEVRQREGFSWPVHVLNSAFTATSAVCVTGLVVYDTSKDYTVFGQAVILLLIQLGGLGIMFFGSAVSLLLARRLTLRHTLVVQDELSYQVLGDLRRMIVFVLVSTLALEAIGAVILYPMWTGTGPVSSRIFHSVFHAISAFCNAGFSLQTDSLVAYRGGWQVYACIMPLIVLGGLGFPVLFDLWEMGASKWRRLRRPRALSLAHPEVLRHRLSLHSRLVLTSTAIFLVVPAVLFVVFESVGTNGQAELPSGEQAVMRDGSLGQRALDSAFLSVTCRTAGFNTVSTTVEDMSPATRFLTCVLMFVGGSPASTAGGVKTMAVTVLALAIFTQLRGRRRTEVYHRTIEEESIQRAGVLVTVMFAIVSATTMLLLVTENTNLARALYEAVSACGTVGLSNGLTSELSVSGRAVVIGAMFAGRLGPLTILIALAGRPATIWYEYPEEKINIG